MTAELAIDPEDVLRQRAEMVRVAEDITLPHLEYWNYQPCRHHDEPKADCEFRACGAHSGLAAAVIRNKR